MDININSQIVVQTAAQWAVDVTVYSEKRILVTSDETYRETNVRKFKIADGVLAWSDLDYATLVKGSQRDAMDNANSPDALNPFATMLDIPVVSTPDLNAVLTAGKSTGGQDIQSPDTNSKLQLINGSAILSYILGAKRSTLTKLADQITLRWQNITTGKDGYFGASANSSTVSHTDQIILDAPSILRAGSEIATQLDLASKADLVGGFVPQSQLPSYVDDILEYADLASFPASGETGKIYVAIDTGKQYRWTGSAYSAVTNGFIASTNDVAEGGTNLYFTVARVLATVLTGLSTATNAVITASDTVLSALGKLQAQASAILVSLGAHIANTGNPHNVNKTQVGLGNVDNTSDANKPISTATQLALDGKLSASLAKGYTIQSFHNTLNPIDSNTYYIGASIQSAVSGGTGNLRRIYIPKAGTINRVDLYFQNTGTLGTAETSTLNVRLNGATSHLISNAVTNDAVSTKFEGTAIGLAVVAGDYVCIEWITPAWATNPTAVFLSAVIYIE